MLELKNIEFSYAKKTILSDINLKVQAGDFLAVLGANGAGKSTLLKIISGLILPKSGEVFLNGKSLSNHKPTELAKMRAVLEQESSLAFDTSVLDVVLMGAFASGNFFASKSEVLLAKNTLKNLGLEGFESRLFSTLSGGEKRRVMLAKTLLQLLLSKEENGKKLLLLDEPSAGLDPAHSHIALSAAKALTEQGVRVIAILHDPNFAAQYANKFLFLKAGKVLSLCDVKSAMNAQILSETYGSKCKIISDPLGDFALFLKQ